MKRKVFLYAMLILVSGAAAAQAKKPLPQKAAPPAAVMQRGKAVFTTLCLPCHQEDGSGVPNLNPPLTPNEWVGGPKERLIGLVLHGSQGKVEIDGDSYNNNMPAQPQLTDQEIADVLTYVRHSFGNKAGQVTAKDVKALRAKGR